MNEDDELSSASSPLVEVASHRAMLKVVSDYESDDNKYEAEDFVVRVKIVIAK